MTQAFDIVIVGAGMVGAALATGLGRSGFRVALVDRGSAPEFDPSLPPDIRVSALSAGSERYLNDLDVWPSMLAMRATPYARLAVWDETRHPLSNLLPRKVADVVFDAGNLSARHLGHIVENRITQQALWNSAASLNSVSLFPDNAVSHLENGNNHAAVTLEDGTELECQLVVGADGAASGVRELAGIGVTRDQYQQQAMVISVRYQGAVEDITWQGFYPSGPRAFLPLHSAGNGESWASLVWYDSPEQLARLKSLDDRALMAEIQNAFPPELPLLTHIEAKASFPIARQHAKTYVNNRVVLAGDAAHTINPLAGQGVNLGFQDALCLQTVIREAKRAGCDLADPAWLAKYEQQRRPANRRMMMAMDVFYHLFSNRTPPLHLLRNLGLGAAKAMPFARNRVAKYAMGIDDELPPLIRQLADRLPGMKQL
ncbi:MULTISPECIES: FAD-dependent monooxygenase [Marinobacter]|jgi:2-octaprenyl-3-methyl-6-methoxy-1,4-benzoquinol hydroxylase|uniref:FAD-dependent monooxygenase n=1 Tax=Marinobacter TaxID=2742 RepID=UPI00056C35FB|nr:FAD-dependent monooxygenase [Marinobacter salarius]AZR41525.1 2-octaprenyl-3-methyl-6-methoxy-1,4-benzoquinol hydroxylase [Marinobacter salarius]MBJ7299447.1 FAD-dependent monooxygenase [Marinobacter salarius]HIO28174.1 ubiquinone biosynthesis protein UbiH [Marinobacter salarius]HIP00209.1 ubiquinone biosynthesis protein UbiH [Marinobacter salarius]